MYHRAGSTARSSRRGVARRMTEDEHHLEAARTPSPTGAPDEDPTGGGDAAHDTDDRTAPDERTDAADPESGVEAARAVGAEATAAGALELACDGGEAGTGDGEAGSGDDTLPDRVASRVQDRFGLSAQRWFVVESFLLVLPYPVFVFVYLSFPVPEVPFFGLTAIYSLFALWFGYRREVPDVDDDAK